MDSIQETLRGSKRETYELYLDGYNRTMYLLVHNPDVNYRYEVHWTWDKGISVDDLTISGIDYE